MDQQGTDIVAEPLEPAPVSPDTAPEWQGPLPSAFDVAAQRTKRAAISQGSPNPAADAAPLPSVMDQASYDAVPAGKNYLDPEGNKRTKAFKVANEIDYGKVPEGSTYLDPEGNKRAKPKFEPVSYTSQTLYDMALTDKEKRKALELSYPGKVKEDARGLYVIDEDGKYRKPGYGLNAVTGGATALAAPVGGSVLGAIGGGAAGTVGGPGGSFVGGAVGAGIGGGSGQAINDLVLQLAGVYDRTPTEQAVNIGLSAGAGMAGMGVGRGIGVIAPTIREGISSASTAAPALLRKALGASEEDLRMAKQIADKGTSVPPSAVLKESPRLINRVERFHPAIDTSNPTLRSIEHHYETEASLALRELGVPEFQPLRGSDVKAPSLLEPGASVPTQRAGEALRERALRESSEADSALTQSLEARKQALTSGVGDQVAQREALIKAADDAKTAATRLVNSGYDEIARTADAAARVSNAGHNGGQLWNMVGAQLQAVKRGLMERANLMYRQADELVPPGVVPNSEGLPQLAQNFLEQLPGEFQAKNPDIVRRLSRFAGEMDNEGNWIREPVVPTFGELRNLRSLLRGSADWHTLSGDLKNGTYKYFSNAVDNALRDVRAVPELAPAVRQLDNADAFYHENMPVFEAKQISAIMKGLEAGEPADPKMLYNTIVKEGHTDLTNRIRDMVGPNLWSGVRAADLRTILDNSRDLAPGVIDGRKFVSEILDRHRSGLLQSIHGEQQANRLLKQAQDVRALSNDRIPIAVQPGDTVAEVIARARQATAEAERAAKVDPIGALNKEMRKLEGEQKRQLNNARSRRDDPLGFLYNPTVGASEAVNKILSSEDLILATGTRFGKDSPEFNMLRQVYAQKILQGTTDPASRLGKVSDEVQALMFPGVTRKQMDTLAKEMTFLTNTKLFSSGDFGGALSATAKVEHPIGGRMVSGVLKAMPGTMSAGVATLGAYYKFLTDMTANNPALFNYLLRGLEGTAAQKTAVREILSKHAQRYGAMGAGAGEALEQQPRESRRKVQ